MTLTIILSLTSPVVALAIALWGFRRHDRAAELSMLFEMQERYLAPQVREGRKLIHLKIAGDIDEKRSACSREELSTIGYALAVMNTIALCAEIGQIDESLLLQSMGQSFKSAVRAAGSYIDQVAATRGYRPYPYAERLAERFDASLGSNTLSPELP